LTPDPVPLSPNPVEDSPPVTPALVVKGLLKRYGDVKAVDGIEFTVQGGEVFGILGPNTPGKAARLVMIGAFARRV
jgi:ABC-type uncharacterized transport system ATPase subunit